MDANKMNLKELSVKCQSKKNMYRILQIEGGIYLSPIKQADHVFIAQIVTGEKRVSILFQCNNVVPTEQNIKVIQVPHLKGLEIDKILSFAKSKANIMKYIPEIKKGKYPSRAYLWNISMIDLMNPILVNSLIPDLLQSLYILLSVRTRKHLY